MFPKMWKSVEQNTAAGRRWLALGIFVASLLLNLAGNGRISLWDRDEPRYAQAARQMLQTGDWVVPHFNTDYRFDKPALIYWLMDAAMKVWGVNEFSARLPAAVAGAATVTIVFYLALAMGCAGGAALLAALIMMTGVLPIVISKAATTDAVLTLTVTVMMALLWRQRQRGFSWATHVALYVMLGLTVLLKGPPGVLVLAAAVATGEVWRWARERREYRFDWLGWVKRWGVGVPVFLAVALPWAILAWKRTDGLYFNVAIGKHVIGRSLKPMESHGGSFLLFLPYYLPVLAGGIFPWTAPALLGLRHAWRQRGEEVYRFLWCWLAPAFVVFSLVQTKLPHYIAPLLPAVALMTARWWQGRSERDEADEAGARWWQWGAGVTGTLGVGAVLTLLGITIYLRDAWLIVAALVPTLLASWGFVLGARKWWRREAAAAMRTWWVTTAALCLVIFLWTLPALEPLKPSKQMVQWVKENAPQGTRLYAAEYREPTLVFYWGDPVVMMDNTSQTRALEIMRRSEPAAIITTQERWNKWTGKVPALKTINPGIVHQKKCFTFQRGRWAEMIVVGNWAAGKKEKAEHPH